MKIDWYYPPSPPQHAGQAAVAASDLGYDGFFTSETRHDPFLPVVMAAGAAPDLDFGTAIAVAFPRSPMVTAMISWDLARMTNGRFILGLGTQVKAHITRRFSTEWDSPGDRLRDYIRALRAIWHAWQSQETLRYQGDFYSFSLMTPFFDPGPIDHPDVPVAIAGVGPYLSRLAGEACDGFHVHPFHTIVYLDQVVRPNIAAGAKDVGRRSADCQVFTSVFVVTGQSQADMEQSLEAVKQQIAFYASTPSYAPVLAANGWDFGPQLTALSKRGKWEEMASVIDDDVVEQVGVIAPPERVGAAIRDRYRDRVQRVGLYMVGAATDLPGEALAQIVGDVKG